MNNERRARIAAAQVLLRDAFNALEELQQEEQDYFDNMPESLQNGQKGDDAQTAIDALETAASEAESAADGLDEVINGVDPAPVPNPLLPLVKQFRDTIKYYIKADTDPEGVALKRVTLKLVEDAIRAHG